METKHEITTGEYNLTPRATCNRHNIGHKTHKVWYCEGVGFFRKSDAVLFANVFFAECNDINYDNLEGSYESWLIETAHTLLRNDRRDDAMAYFKRIETLKYI
jgi:hypothetical protein